MLKLSAKLVDEDTIGVLVNGRNRGILVLPIEEANELVALLNAATEMREIVQELADVIGWHGFCCAPRPTAPEGCCTCLPCKARSVLAKAKGPTT